MSEDDYHFSLSSTSDVEVQPGGCPYFGTALHWVLVRDSTGATVASQDNCSSGKLTGLSSGAYTLATTVQDGHTGAYNLSVFVVPPPDSFLVSLPLSASDGSPGAGAGNLETIVSEDDYHFSIVGTALTITPGSCPYFGTALHWALIRVSDNAIVASQGSCGAQTVTDLTSGSYEVVVTPEDGHTGIYTLSIAE